MNEAVLGFWTLIKWFRSWWMATICCLKTIYTVGFRGALRHASLPLPLSDWKIGDWHPPTASLRLSAWFSHFFLSLTILCCSQTSGFDRILHGYLLLSWLPHAMRKKSLRLPRHFLHNNVSEILRVHIIRQQWNKTTGEPFQDELYIW